MNAQRRRIWFAFAIGVVLVVVALSWASASVYKLETRNDENRAMAQRQELIRLALWRMDSRIAPLIALEAARPPEAYRAMTPTLAASAEFVNGYFQDSPGAATDPATERIARLAFDDSASTQWSQGAIASKDAYSERAAQPSAAAAPEAEPAQVESLGVRAEEAADYIARRKITNELNQSAAAQLLKDQGESVGAFSALDDSRSDSAEVRAPVVSAVEPVWVRTPEGSAELVLMRTVTIGPERVTQGVWLDWASLRDELLGLVRDLLPTSTLDPSDGFSESGYMLATIPASFVPGGAVALPGDRLTPAIIAMLITWVAVVFAIVVVGFVLRAVLNLSDRRGRFVSAVTHELRTPLTTFRLYAQMLADGMVTDESVRTEYLSTLKRESDRLSGIVENVLEYARLSRRKPRGSRGEGERTISAGELMARIVPPMSRRAEQSGMDLIVSDDLGEARDRDLTLDPHAVERIMMNLTENACRYAGPGPDQGDDTDTRVHLDACVIDGAISLLVADHGRGVAPGDRRRIFGEFARGSGQAERDRSGLGLGLALSRGLAREMGGDLRLVRRRGHGAEFELTIPLD